MKKILILVSLMTAFSSYAHAQVQSAATKNPMPPVVASNPVKTSSLTISLTAKGDYTLGSEQDKNLKKPGKLGGATDVDTLNKKLLEMINGASEVAINIRVEQASKFQYFVDIMSTAALQTIKKFTIATETSQCTVQVPLDGLPKSAHLTVQISANGDYAMQIRDKDGKSKSGNVVYKHEKMANLADAFVYARKSNPGLYALINADKDSPILAYVDLINMLHAASIDKHMIIAQSAGRLAQNGSEQNQLRTQQLRVAELEAQQRQLLEQLKKMK